MSVDARVAAVRGFNRFYTRQIGVLQDGLLGSDLSLTEARVLFELAQQPQTIASELGASLGLDAGYLSRILRGFARRSLIERMRAGDDARRRPIVLTEAGRAAFAQIDRRSRDEVGAMLAQLAEPEQERVVGAMRGIEALLAPPAPPPAAFVLRPHRPGDIGWVVQRHGALYAAEYGWDETFEALVAEIAAGFLRGFDARRERCWIAERDGEPVGSAFVVRHADEVAKLRLLLVEPRARGHGLGALLVGESLRFARSAGYRRMSLWTNHVLLAARAIYLRCGFRKVAEEPHRSFGHDLIGETWERDL